MRFQKTLLTLLCTFFLGNIAFSQDNHFSQFYNSPLTLNPALTGLIGEDLRATVQYRNQWATVTVPYETMAASVDFSILKGSLGDDYVGVGLLMFNDVAGDGRLRNTQAQLSMSYNKALTGDANQYLTAGVQVGMAQQSINLNNIMFDSQFDGAILNTNISSGETIDRPTYTYPDVSTGLAWYFVPDERTSFYLGAALFHLNRPNLSFFSEYNDPLDRRLTLHAGMEVPIGASLSLIPRAVMIRQGPYSELNVGGLLKFEVHPDYGSNYGQAAFYVGTMHRVGDAQIAIVRFDYNNVGITASYDVNISDLSNASRGNGGFELALVYKTFLFDNAGLGGPVGCPTW